MAKVAKYLIKSLKEIMNDDSLTWEQKHQKIFLDGLKSAIIEHEESKTKLITTYLETNSSDKSECEQFFNWASNN
jgi:hypothetical protein